MKPISSKKFIKLGTSIRYLIDVKSGEQLAGNKVLGNIKSVLDLIEELEFSSVSVERLVGIQGELNLAATSQTSINTDQARRLEAVCRKVRSGILAEGGLKDVYILSEEERISAEAPGWPSEVTLPLLAKTPFNIWKWLLGLVLASFLAGVGFSQTNLYHSIVSAFESRGGSESEPAAGSEDTADTTQKLKN